MKMRAFTLALMGLMLSASAGMAVAMDSAYLEKRQQRLYEVVGQPEVKVSGESRAANEQDHATKQRSVRTLNSEGVSRDRTSELLHPWWR